MTKAEATGGEQAHKQREALAATMARGSTVRVLTTARSVTLELQTDRIPTALRKETIFGVLDLFRAKVRRSHHYGTCQLPRLVSQNQSNYYYSSWEHNITVFARCRTTYRTQRRWAGHGPSWRQLAGL